jgi:hypothetical protein
VHYLLLVLLFFAVGKYVEPPSDFSACQDRDVYSILPIVSFSPSADDRLLMTRLC